VSTEKFIKEIRKKSGKTQEFKIEKFVDRQQNLKVGIMCNLQESWRKESEENIKSFLKVKKTRVLKNDKYLQADVSSH
jgi:signal recognition particle receptor subunit beta